MSDEEKKNVEETSVEEKATKSGKGGLIKYLLFGVIGIVVLGGVIFGTLMFLGPNKASVEESSEEAHNESADQMSDEKNDASGEHADSKAAKSGNHESNEPDEDSIMALLEQDESVLEEIVKNLEYLDYDPSESDVAELDDSASIRDSLEKVNWFEEEKKRLAAKEKDLNLRESELKKLDREVSKKIRRIEQAESSRIGNLAKLYDGMESRSVAKLMANLDDNTVVSLLPRMKQKNASQVMSLMPAKRAARLSKQMITIAVK